MQAALACRTCDVSTLFPVPTSTALGPTRYNGAGQALQYNTLDVRRIPDEPSRWALAGAWRGNRCPANPSEPRQAPSGLA